MRRFRHKKRGSTYTLVAEAEFQCSAMPPIDGLPVTIYRGDDGKFWVRGTGEFHDGRFEEIEPGIPVQEGDVQRLMVKFAQAADFTTEQDRRIYDTLFDYLKRKANVTS